MSMRESQVEFDPVTLEILWNRLIAIADESAATLVRTSFSTIVRESNDYACSLLNAEGDTLADSTVSIPSFVGCMPQALRHCLKRYPPETLQPGDVLIVNDPWMTTGHLHDITMLAPIYCKGKLVAFAGNVAHTTDIGGGMWSADAQDLFEEGLRLVPVKLMKAGQLNQELLELIRANVRTPEQVTGDLFAQVAACNVCSRRVVDLLEEQGMEDLSALGKAIQDRAEAVMRRAIEAVPDGEYSYALETDGFDHPLTIRIRITVAGSNLHVDYAGTSPQINRGLNSVMNYTYAYTTYPLKCLLDPFTPKNEGSYRSITVEAPEGSVLNPRYPAPVDARHLVAHFLTSAVFGAMATALPNQVIADPSGPNIRLFYLGTGDDGQKYGVILFPSGGMGARPNRDGISCVPFPSNACSGSFEALEAVSPLMAWKRELRRDSAGPGRFRGGLGEEVVVGLASREPARVSIHSERLRHPPLGILGGLPGAAARIVLNDGDPVPGKGRTLFQPGDVVRLCYAGGGGYGPPRDRDRALVLEDLKNELISHEAAREVYGLVESGSDDFSRSGRND